LSLADNPGASLPLIVLGTGGHAAVVIEALQSTRRFRIGGLADDVLARHGHELLGHPICALGDYPLDWPVLIAIGDNAIRARVVSELTALGRVFAPPAVHASAVVSPTAVLGEGSVVMAGAIVNARTNIGTHVIVNTGATVDHDCTLRDFVHVSPGAHLGGGVTVGACCHIGIGATVLPSLQVGENTIVGGGAVVIRDLASSVVVVGNPARPLRTSK
jgi:acetyltransferase EpsM